MHLNIPGHLKNKTKTKNKTKKHRFRFIGIALKRKMFQEITIADRAPPDVIFFD